MEEVIVIIKRVSIEEAVVGFEVETHMARDQVEVDMTHIQ
jgi:hypothetical protein